MELRAHTPNQKGEWHSLQAHLQGVCQRAGRFAEAFGAPNLSKALAYLHDLGKARAAFQDYLDAVASGQRDAGKPHAIWGAVVAYLYVEKKKQRKGWEALALPVMGHHTGLPARGKAISKLEEALSDKLEEALSERKEALEEVFNALKTMGRMATLEDLLQKALEELQAKVQGDCRTRRLKLEFLIRMAFSTLVDADYLDTEAHFSPETAHLRQRTYRLEELWNAFRRDQETLLQRASPSPVNQVRREVYEACLRAAKLPPGLFRLTVPTGGGKTRSGLAFALKHACLHNLQRIVVAIPYTSIIDQTAEVYRGILGEEAVLEHHSAYEPPLGEEQGEAVLRQRLATENWDAPLVITTTVQLFESLFANRPSKMRKIHRLARSVILLDEVQTLPPELLEPTLEALRLLATPVEEGGYGATVVLSTATQPAFEAIPTFKGFPIREIVPNYPEHFTRLERVEYEHREDPLSWQDLAEELGNRCQVMAVLNTRRDALALLKALEPDPDTFHLSTLLCPAHRREILQEVRKRLEEGRPVRLVSTQVVEAGVDLDFPEVWRAVGPLDRVVQAAGRCNREGRLGKGRVILFWPKEGISPGGPYRVGIEKARLLLSQNPPERLHDPQLYEVYFRELFTTVETDAQEIQVYRQNLDYPEVAKRYRLIPEDTVPVVVPYGEWRERLKDFQSAPSMETWRRLQPYVVGLFRHQVEAFRKLLKRVGDVYVWKGKYDPKRGLVADDDPSDLIV